VPWAAAVTSALKPSKRKLKVTRTISVSDTKTVTSTASQQRSAIFGFLAPPPLNGRVTSTSSRGSDEEKEGGEASFSPPLSDDDGTRTPPLSADPDSYLYAKRKLKKAVIEHYRYVTPISIESRPDSLSVDWSFCTTIESSTSLDSARH